MGMEYTERPLSRNQKKSVLHQLYKIAIIQHAPVFLNLLASVECAKKLILEAVSHGTRLVVFPETWLPGYPVWLDYAPKAALWQYPPATAAFRILFDNSITIGDESFKNLQECAKNQNCTVVMGAHERVARTLYNTIFYFLPDGTYQLHRKLVPTYTERLIWGMGDGSTLSTIKDKEVEIGGLICWEHWMPLARAAMHQLGEHIHIAQWPMVKDLHQIASRQYAFEGQCFVLATGCILTKRQMLDGINTVIKSYQDESALELLNSIPIEPDSCILKGGSSVIAPTSEYQIAPLQEQEGIIYADLDLTTINDGNLFIDTNGHYSRPDVFTLKVNTRSKKNVRFED